MFNAQGRKAWGKITTKILTEHWFECFIRILSNREMLKLAYQGCFKHKRFLSAWTCTYFTQIFQSKSLYFAIFIQKKKCLWSSRFKPESKARWLGTIALHSGELDKDFKTMYYNIWLPPTAFKEDALQSLFKELLKCVLCFADIFSCIHYLHTLLLLKPHDPIPCFSSLSRSSILWLGTVIILLY